MTTRRLLLLPALLLAHAAVLLPVLFAPPASVEARPTVAITVSERPDVVAAPAAVFEPTFTSIAVNVDAPPFEISEDTARPATLTTAVGSDGCRISDSVQAALHGDPAVRNALDLIPTSARSVADAMLLWDGHWSDAGAIGGVGALAPIRSVVIGAVLAATPDCRDAPLAGPRLIYVMTAAGTRVLAFGSGSWTWAQLVDDSTATNRAAAFVPGEITTAPPASTASMNT